MSFAYSIPLSTFSDLFARTERPLRQELAERLRTEIHSDLSQRLTGPRVQTFFGLSSGPFDSIVFNDSIIIYSPGDWGEVMEAAGQPRPGLFGQLNPFFGFSLIRPRVKTLRETMNDSWRYPGSAGGGIFSSSVAKVLAQQHVLIKEFEAKSQELRERSE